ncbi:MAG: type II toxin-antitoxin system VapC family toxin [Actinomycetota bacterium]|nr:type II toxin-antitoxin system VapC family toxin [Actinomycetota bacterium]
MIVVDASVLVTALGDDGPDGRRARARLVGERLAAPAIVDLEVLSAWRRIWLAGQLGLDRVDAALADLESLRLERVPHRRMLRRCWELRDNATVYDAAYVALAEHLGVTLVTADRRLTEAPGPRCEVELIA